MIAIFISSFGDRLAALLEEAYRREGRYFIGNSVVQCDKTLESFRYSRTPILHF
jgi:hypothetical protein